MNGIGPRIALAVISTLDASALRQTVLLGKVATLESVPGIGKRTAEKMILELKPKMEKLSFASPTLADPTKSSQNRQSGARGNFDFDLSPSQGRQAKQQAIMDVRSALENLGYKDKDVLPILSSMEQCVSEGSDSTDFQSLLKSALKSIRAGM